MIKLERLGEDYVELYERLGGAPVLGAAIAAFHAAMTQDARLKVFFEGNGNAQLLNRLTTFFTMAYGGPNTYEGLDMRRAHAGARAQGLDDGHLEIAIAHFRAALAAQNIAPALIAEAESYLQSMRDDILGR
jgi:hemoglobin